MLQSTKHRNQLCWTGDHHGGRFLCHVKPKLRRGLAKDCIAKAEETFRKQHPAFTDYLFTGIKGPGHFVRFQMVEKEHQAMPKDIFSDGSLQEVPASSIRYQGRTGSGIVERLQYAGYLGQIHRSREPTTILHQALAELSVDLSHADITLLQALMADTMNTLEERRTDRERVWNEMQKVGILEDLLFQLEETYLKNKAQRARRKQRTGAQGVEGKALGRPKAEAKGGATVETDKAKGPPTAVAPMTLPDPGSDGQDSGDPPSSSK
ncbi:unnamed protein product [Coregonus sp. 'balchen']|nr:unnamed protein product [Coregonus sp. 'balchen']